MLHFTVASSSDAEERFSLRARPTEDGIRFACSCPASLSGGACAHRIRLLRGHVDGLRSGNAWEVLRLRRLAETTPIPALLSELDEAEQEIAAAQSHLEGVERRLAIAMMG